MYLEEGCRARRKDAREQCRIQGTWNMVRQGRQGTVQDGVNMEQNRERKQYWMMQGTWNRVKEVGQGTVQHAGNMEQSTESRSGNSTGCREHGTEYIKIARE